MRPASPRYGDYLKALSEAYEAGLVTVSPENNQALLTDAGIDFCRSTDNDLSGDFWLSSR